MDAKKGLPESVETEKTLGVTGIWCRREDSNLRSPKAVDLQSTAIAAMRPRLMVTDTGFEPVLQG